MLQSSNLNENQIKETYFTYSLSPINFILLFSLIHGEDRFEMGWKVDQPPVKRSEHVYCVGMTTFLSIFIQLLARRLMKMSGRRTSWLISYPDPIVQL